MVLVRCRSKSEVDARCLVVGIAGDVDNARLAGREAVEQRHGEREMAQVVDPEHQLEAILGQAPLATDPGVVDQDVQLLAGRQEGLRAGPYRNQVGQVERQEADILIAGGGDDASDGGLAFLRRPAGDVHPSATRRQRPRGSQADPGIGAGHQEGLPGKLLQISHYRIMSGTRQRYQRSEPDVTVDWLKCAITDVHRPCLRASWLTILVT